MENKNIEKEKSYWENFYSTEIIKVPSQFCVLFACETNKKVSVIEFGCGNGRDSIFLARQGYNVYALDASNVAIDSCIEKTKLIHNISFFQGDVANEIDVKQIIETARANNGGIPVTVYSRFFLHSINEEQENYFLSSMSKNLKKGEKIYLEFREKRDEALSKTYNNHYRRYIEEKKFIANLEIKYGFHIEYHNTGTGMAKYFDEDPIVCRIIANKS